MDIKKDSIAMDQAINRLPQCQICYNPIQEQITFKCQHYCCRLCWEGIIKNAITTNKVNDIKCFEDQCRKKIKNINELVLYLFDPGDIKRFNYLQKRQEIHKDENKFMCPKCDEILHVDDQEKIIVNYKKMGLFNTNDETNKKIKIKPLYKLDYYFLICSKCYFVFCKICDVYHEPGTSNCMKKIIESNNNVLKVDAFNFVYLYIIISNKIVDKRYETLPKMQITHFQNKWLQPYDMWCMSV